MQRVLGTLYASHHEGMTRQNESFVASIGIGFLGAFPLRVPSLVAVMGVLMKEDLEKVGLSAYMDPK